MNKLPPNAEMEAAYLRRDSSYDGIFFLGVRTTGIFCRPNCPARSPLPSNVVYLSSAAEAVFAGYRPCKRCRPMATTNQPDWATDLIAQVEANPSIRITEKDLRGLGVDPATVRRYFLRNYGMTFLAYTRARRLSAAFHEIRSGASVDQAALNSGFESLSGFREAFGQSIGAPPGSCHDRDCVVIDWVPSPLGPLVAGATIEGVCLLEFHDRRMLEAQLKTLGERFRCPILPGSNAQLELLKEELMRYFEGDLRSFSVPLIFPGSPFQERVWQALREIPYGETRSYHDIATVLGDPNAVRAVGRANGLNRISIVIPCHRVVRKDGALGGYGGGLRRKQILLNLEQVTLGKSELDLII